MAFVKPKSWSQRPQWARPQGARPQWTGARPQGTRPQWTGTRPQWTWARPQWAVARPQGARPQQKSFDRRPQMVYTNEQIKAPTIVIVDEEGNSVW